MALINCPECSKSISDQSNFCPNCGFVTNRIHTPVISAPIRNSQAHNPQKKGGCSGPMIIFIIIIMAIGYWVKINYDSYIERTERYRKEQSQENIEPNTNLTSIPMSDSFENGRYFLTSQTTENGIENIEYIRKGDNNTSYGKMQIKCSNNEIKKYSADNSDALQSADMGNWITPAPDWTDQDIVNFICK